MNILITDLDGTLFDTSHRLHMIEESPKDWDGFYKACKDDKPIVDRTHLVRMILNNPDTKLVVMTGRRETERESTINALKKEALTKHCIGLYMRPSRDWRKDYIVKQEWLNQLKIKHPDANILGVLEDRKQCVDMFRREGLFVMQVQDGNF